MFTNMREGEGGHDRIARQMRNEPEQPDPARVGSRGDAVSPALPRRCQAPPEALPSRPPRCGRRCKQDTSLICGDESSVHGVHAARTGGAGTVHPARNRRGRDKSTTGRDTKTRPGSTAGAGRLRLVAPSEPPPFTPGAARALLRILVQPTAPGHDMEEPE